jgi:hypothetical protein
MNNAILMATIAAALTASVCAQDWLDNFNDGSVADGSPVTWVPSPAFAAQFAVANGDMVVNVPVGASPAISSPRVSVNFKSGASVRARMIASNGPGRFTVAFADQATGIKGYVASFSTVGTGTIELFRGDAPGIIFFLGGGPIPWPSSPLEEFLIQLDVFDGVVSARVWRPGEAFPAPQISAADATYASGVASIAIQDFGGTSFSDATAVVRFAQASSTPLTHSGVGDTTADGVVNVDDLLHIINTWGPCSGACPPTCSADIAPAGGDCMVNIDDLLAVINNWG